MSSWHISNHWNQKLQWFVSGRSQQKKHFVHQILVNILEKHKRTWHLKLHKQSFCIIEKFKLIYAVEICSFWSSLDCQDPANLWLLRNRQELFTDSGTWAHESTKSCQFVTTQVSTRSCQFIAIWGLARTRWLSNTTLFLYWVLRFSSLS